MATIRKSKKHSSKNKKTHKRNSKSSSRSRKSLSNVKKMKGGMNRQIHDYNTREAFKKNILGRIRKLDNSIDKTITTKCSIEFNHDDFLYAKDLLDANITDANIIYNTISSLYY
jgi:hypothetical protein